MHSKSTIREQDSVETNNNTYNSNEMNANGSNNNNYNGNKQTMEKEVQVKCKNTFCVCVELCGNDEVNYEKDQVNQYDFISV